MQFVVNGFFNSLYFLIYSTFGWEKSLVRFKLNGIFLSVLQVSSAVVPKFSILNGAKQNDVINWNN